LLSCFFFFLSACCVVSDLYFIFLYYFFSRLSCLWDFLPFVLMFFFSVHALWLLVLRQFSIFHFLFVSFVCVSCFVILFYLFFFGSLGFVSLFVLFFFFFHLVLCRYPSGDVYCCPYFFSCFFSFSCDVLVFFTCVWFGVCLRGLFSELRLGRFYLFFCGFFWLFFRLL